MEKRYRINVKETAKHEKYFDCTVELTGEEVTEEMAVEASTSLVAKLTELYPAQEVKP